MAGQNNTGSDDCDVAHERFERSYMTLWGIARDDASLCILCENMHRFGDGLI